MGVKRGLSPKGEQGSKKNIGPKRDEVTGEWRKLHNTMRNFIICTHPQISLGRSSEANEMARACGTHRKGEEIVGTKCCWESPKERDYSEEQGVSGSMESEWILGRLAGGC
jgi:hypothetical protein